MRAYIQENLVFFAELFGPFDELAFEQTFAPIIIQIYLGQQKYLAFARIYVNNVIVDVIVRTTRCGPVHQEIFCGHFRTNNDILLFVLNIYVGSREKHSIYGGSHTK